jgi:biofilm PGA synthesis protein PgaA
MALVPEDQHVRRLSQDVAAAGGWALDAEFGPKWNEGGGANASGKEWTSSVRLESPRLVQGFSLFALTDASVAHPPEGRASRYRAGGGIAFHGADVSTTLYAVNSWGALSRGGAGFSLDWQANDRLSFGLSGETFSRETPLRAVLHGITADSLAAKIGWRWDERTSVSAGGSWLSYSDGNDRLATSLSAERLLWAGPHIDVTGGAGLWYAHNSQPGGPYFAPAWELSGSGSLTVRHIAWRRYETSFSHALTVELGFQDQNGFAAHWTGSVRYEQRWRRDPWWEIYYAALIDRRVYDGQPERGIGAIFGLRRRF